jgi:hypothetical protein
MTLWPKAFSKPYYSPEFHLYFGSIVYRGAVPAQIMWNFPSNEVKSSYSSFRSVSTRPAKSFDVSTQFPPNQGPANLPMTCYIGKTQLASVRSTSFRLAYGPGRSWNEPVFRLQQLRARMLVLSNSDQDAHFVGICLGMAQKHFYPSPPTTGRHDSRISPEQGIPPCPNFHGLKLRILTARPLAVWAKLPTFENGTGQWRSGETLSGGDGTDDRGAKLPTPNCQPHKQPITDSELTPSLHFSPLG